MREIGKAVAKDEAAIRACVETAYAPYVAAIGRRPAPMMSDFASLIAAGHVHVAKDADGMLQGVIVFFPEGKGMFLDCVAVQPELSGKGIGKALIGFCEHEARRLGMGCVHLYTNEKMTDNLAIYPRLGYTEVDRRSADGYNRVFFEKALR